MAAADLDQCQNEEGRVPAAIGSLVRAAAELDMRGSLDQPSRTRYGRNAQEASM